MADKLRTQQELERLQAKYVGTGHPDTTSWEWRTNVQRDTLASIVGHRPLLAYIALAENEPIAKVRADLIRKMVQPCGPPPHREEQPRPGEQFGPPLEKEPARPARSGEQFGPLRKDKQAAPARKDDQAAQQANEQAGPSREGGQAEQ